jgi:hypothetical protein
LQDFEKVVRSFWGQNGSKKLAPILLNIHLAKGVLMRGMGFYSTVKVLGAIALLTATSGCKDFKGKIDILKPLELNVVAGDSDIGPGVSDITVTFKSSHEVKLEISKPGKDNNPKVLFQLPEELRVPRYNGPIEIPAEVSGQLYDVLGHLETDIIDSPIIRDREYCSRKVRRRVCHKDGDGNRICRDKKVRLKGRRRVAFFEREAFARIDLNLEEVEGGELAATLKAFDRTFEKIYTHRGPCRVRRPHR